jgi:membrane protease subunit (stomatin/prohibitin family)
MDAGGKVEAATRSAAGALKLLAELKPLMQPAAQAAALVRQYWQLPEQVAAARLEVAQAAATRSCAYLGCANLGMSGGLAAGQGVGSKLCSGCRVAWYCGSECSHADWKTGGHRRVCKELAAARGRVEADAHGSA